MCHGTAARSIKYLTTALTAEINLGFSSAKAFPDLQHSIVYCEQADRSQCIKVLVSKEFEACRTIT